MVNLLYILLWFLSFRLGTYSDLLLSQEINFVAANTRGETSATFTLEEGQDVEKTVAVFCVRNDYTAIGCDKLLESVYKILNRDTIFPRTQPQSNLSDFCHPHPTMNENGHGHGNSPLVSIIIPSIGRTQILTALKSLDLQTDRDFEAILVLDGISLLDIPFHRSLRRHRSFLCVVELAPTDRGGRGGSSGAARNIGITYASGNFVAFLNDDDALSPYYVHRLRQEYEKDPALDAVLFRTYHPQYFATWMNILPPPATSKHQQYDTTRAGKLSETLFRGIGYSILRRHFVSHDVAFMISAGVGDVAFNLLDMMHKNGYRIILSPYVTYISHTSRTRNTPGLELAVPRTIHADGHMTGGPRSLLQPLLLPSQPPDSDAAYAGAAVASASSYAQWWELSSSAYTRAAFAEAETDGQVLGSDVLWTNTTAGAINKDLGADAGDEIVILLLSKRSGAAARAAQRRTCFSARMLPPNVYYYFLVGDKSCRIPESEREESTRWLDCMPKNWHEDRHESNGAGAPNTEWKEYEEHLKKEEEEIRTELRLNQGNYRRRGSEENQTSDRNSYNNINRSNNGADIALLANLTDTYRNLPKKVKYGLQWALERHPRAQWFVKMDDDAYVRVRLLQMYLSALIRAHTLNHDLPADAGGGGGGFTKAAAQGSTSGETRQPQPQPLLVVGSIVYGNRILHLGRNADLLYYETIKQRKRGVGTKEEKEEEEEAYYYAYPPYPVGSRGYALSRGVVELLVARRDQLHDGYANEDTSLGIWISELAAASPASPTFAHESDSNGITSTCTSKYDGGNENGSDYNGGKVPPVAGKVMADVKFINAPDFTMSGSCIDQSCYTGRAGNCMDKQKLIVGHDLNAGQLHACFDSDSKKLVYIQQQQQRRRRGQKQYLNLEEYNVSSRRRSHWYRYHLLGTGRHCDPREARKRNDGCIDTTTTNNENTATGVGATTTTTTTTVSTGSSNTASSITQEMFRFVSALGLAATTTVQSDSGVDMLHGEKHAFIARLDECSARRLNKTFDIYQFLRRMDNSNDDDNSGDVLQFTILPSSSRQTFSTSEVCMQESVLPVEGSSMERRNSTPTASATGDMDQQQRGAHNGEEPEQEPKPAVSAVHGAQGEKVANPDDATPLYNPQLIRQLKDYLQRMTSNSKNNISSTASRGDGSGDGGLTVEGPLLSYRYFYTIQAHIRQRLFVFHPHIKQVAQHLIFKIVPELYVWHSRPEEQQEQRKTRGAEGEGETTASASKTASASNTSTSTSTDDRGRRVVCVDMRFEHAGSNSHPSKDWFMQLFDFLHQQNALPGEKQTLPPVFVVYSDNFTRALDSMGIGASSSIGSSGTFAPLHDVFDIRLATAAATSTTTRTKAAATTSTYTAGEQEGGRGRGGGRGGGGAAGEEDDNDDEEEESGHESVAMVDMAVMSSGVCSDIILTTAGVGSTGSVGWWAAFLAPSSTKVYYYSNAADNVDEYYPPSWLRVVIQ